MNRKWILPLVTAACLVAWSQDCSAGFPRVFRWLGEGWSDGYHTPGEHWGRPPQAAWTVPMPAIHTYPLSGPPWPEAVPHQPTPWNQFPQELPETKPAERIVPAWPAETIPPGPPENRIRSRAQGF